jgi:hypothetical protein
MSAHSFLDFCHFLISKKDDPEFELDGSFVDFFVNFMEPYASENDIDIPDELIELVEDLYDEDGDDEEEDDDEES